RVGGAREGEGGGGEEGPPFVREEGAEGGGGANRGYGDVLIEDVRARVALVRHRGEASGRRRGTRKAGANLGRAARRRPGLDVPVAASVGLVGNRPAGERAAVDPAVALEAAVGNGRALGRQ